MYLALARKYRPQRFADLIGQPHITKTLQNAIKMGKLYPALIFSGMKGVGKTSASRILAKTLNCEKGPDIEPCNECSTCKEITGDSSPDYLEIDGASNNGIEEIRSLKETVKYKPLKNRYRIVVIDEVHMLSTSAWNALLKTVEEPPEHTYFIMATTDFHKIPATIVSRCQHFEFKRIPYETMEILLKNICEKEDIKISKYALHIISKSSEGSLRDAKKILDQAIAISNGDVKDEEVIDILGIIKEDVFIDIIKYILTENRKGIIEIINDLSERGVDLRFFYGEYLKFLRELIILKSVKDATSLININPETIKDINLILKDISDIELLRYFNATRELEITMRHTESPKIILEYLLIKLSYFPSLVPIEDLIKSIDKGKVSIPLEVQPQTKRVEPEIKKHSIQDENIQKEQNLEEKKTELNANDLKGVLISGCDVNPRLASDLGNSRFTLNNEDLILEFDGDMDMSYENVKNNLSFLQNIINEKYNKQFIIKPVLSNNSNREEQKKKTDEIKKDTKINKLADKIKGKIISVESID